MKKAADAAREAVQGLDAVAIPETYDLGKAPAAIPLKTLNELSVEHLSGGNEQRFREARQKASEWIRQRPRDPGLSFVLTGSVGTGKTTIIQNLRQSAQTEYQVLDDDGNPLGDPFRSINSRFYTATDFMALMDPGRRQGEFGTIGRVPLYETFRGVEVIAIDDIGTEELAFVSKDQIDIARQNRYREAFAYFYEHRISVLITSMVPDRIGGQPNPDFIYILGTAAYDRLCERAAGYFVDLTGLPSYRQISGGKA